MFSTTEDIFLTPSTLTNFVYPESVVIESSVKPSLGKPAGPGLV